MDTQNSDEAENDPFETIEPEKDNPVRKEFEIEQLGQQELQEDEITRDETGNRSRAIKNLPSENFNNLGFDAHKKTVINDGLLQHPGINVLQLLRL